MKKKYFSSFGLCKTMAASLLFSTQAFAQKPVIHSPVVEVIDSGFVFTEGPLWSASHGLLFSDVLGDIVYQYKPSIDSAEVFLRPSSNSNGLKWDSTGALLLAQHGKRRIARISNGVETDVASTYKDKKLNSPNDLTVKSGGSIFFTDPPYGIEASQAELNYAGVFRISPKGKVTVIDSTLELPNGIVFSPDEKVLYVNNSANNTIYKWNVVNDSTFLNKQVFATVSGNAPGSADGMTVDSLGNLYSTGSGGIWIIAPNGTVLDTIAIPGEATNVAFGGKTWDTLYVTAIEKVYRVYNTFVTGLKEAAVESAPTLFSVYPNPVSNNATIPVSLPRSGYVKLQVLNQHGQVIANIADENMPAGEYSFHWNCESQSGLYLIKLTYNDRSYAKTCVVNGN